MKLTINQLRRIIAEETHQVQLEARGSTEAEQRWEILFSLLKTSAPRIATLPGLREEFVNDYSARQAEGGNAARDELWILLGALGRLI